MIAEVVIGMRDSVGSVRHLGNVVVLNYTYCFLRQPRRVASILF